LTRVDFYLLQDLDPEALQRFACRLASKALSSGKRVHLHTDDSTQAQAIDELLWRYPEQRFLPHAQLTAQTSKQPTALAPISIGSNDPKDCDEVLINLASSIPTFFGRFDRVAEIVLGNQREAGRVRYKSYRDRGYPLFHHDMDDWES
jgi:DNA polymerase-3 subunit chi